MAGADGSAASAVAWCQRLAQAPTAFDLLFALRILECSRPDLPRLGKAPRPTAEAVRLSQPPSLAFPSSMVSGLSATAGGIPRLETQVLGMFGVNGPLPLHLTEYAAQRKHHDKDGAFAAFADLFHHRMLSLFYRAWACAEPVVQADRPAQDGFSRCVGALMGMGLASTQGRDDLVDGAKRYFAGHYATGTRHGDGLCAMVKAHFGVEARIEEFIGEWVPLPAGEGLTLGRASAHTAALGRSTVIGTRIYLRQHKFRIELGPLSSEDFQRFQHEGVGLRALVAMVRGYVGPELSWDLRLVLAQRDRHSWFIGNQVRLGRTSWLAVRSSSQRSDELTFDPEIALSKQWKPKTNATLVA